MYVYMYKLYKYVYVWEREIQAKIKEKNERKGNIVTWMRVYLMCVYTRDLPIKESTY